MGFSRLGIQGLGSRLEGLGLSLSLLEEVDGEGFGA